MGEQKVIMDISELIAYMVFVLLGSFIVIMLIWTVEEIVRVYKKLFKNNVTD